MRWIVLLLSSLLLTGAISCTDDNTNSSSSNTIIGGDTSCEHNWTDWTQDQEATCKTTGLKSRSCTLCEAKEEKVIEKSVHKYNSENVCEYCGVELAYTSGLDYERLGYFSSSYYYVVKGIGTATETDIVIPAQHAGYPVKSIASEAFYGNDQITSVIAPSIEEIEREAFYYCEKLHSIEFNSVKTIGYGAFKNCKKLNKITLPKTKLEIGNTAFLGTELFNNDKNWENKALYINEHLISVKEEYEEKTFTIKSGTLSVADCAFENVSAIETIQFPENEIFIGTGVFSGCEHLEELEITDTMEMNEYALRGTSLTKLVVPAQYVEEQIEIDDYFRGVDIDIPNTLTTLIVTGHFELPTSGGGRGRHSQAVSFSEFKQLETLELLGDKSYAWGTFYEAFKELKNLKSLKMNGIQCDHIGEFFSSTYYEGSVAITAYVNNRNRTYYFPASLTEITIDGGYVSNGMFYGCDNFQSITIKNLSKKDKGNMGTDALTNVTCENLTIDNSISNLSNIFHYEIIGVKNFYYLGTLQEWCSIKRSHVYGFLVDDIYINGQKMEGALTLPEGMTELPERAFSGFHDLTSIVIPDSVTYIGDYVFYGCNSLTSIVIPNSVTSIGTYAFDDCSSLTIFCEATTKPDGWSNSWNSSNCPVVWGYKE